MRQGSSDQKTSERGSNETEFEIQRKLFVWIASRASLDLRFLNIFAIPNAGKRSYSEASKMLHEGLKKGVPDIFVAVPSKKYPGMFLETKSAAGKLESMQEVWRERLMSQGYKHEVYRSVEEGQNFILDYFY